MSDRLHPFLALLCLLDLGFVHSTNAVSIPLLLPMWLFALASPWLRRLQCFLLYRAAWNGGVLIAFSLLVQHATTSGMLHMLEDGLVLAVLCQVHLLNNVGDQQRPDLTFFNSFLIAFVTSFFAPDFWWSLLFVAHTVAFVPALQVYVLTGSGQIIQKQDIQAVIRDSIPRTFAIAGATVLVTDRAGHTPAALAFTYSQYSTYALLAEAEERERLELEPADFTTDGEEGGAGQQQMYLEYLSRGYKTFLSAADDGYSAT